MSSQRQSQTGTDWLLLPTSNIIIVWNIIKEMTADIKNKINV